MNILRYICFDFSIRAVFIPNAIQYVVRDMQKLYMGHVHFALFIIFTTFISSQYQDQSVAYGSNKKTKLKLLQIWLDFILYLSATTNKLYDHQLSFPMTFQISF